MIIGKLFHQKTFNKKAFVHFFIIFFTLLILVTLYKNSVARSIGASNLDKNSEYAQKVIIDRHIELALEKEGAKIPPGVLADGCTKKDCIPSIDDPVFESVVEADEWLDDDHRVMILDHNGIVKIYPQNIMGWHEIVNDWFDNEAVAVTFCPLCGTATAFTREIDGVTTEFGVSGKLYDANLVMYDRYQGSLWQQITGEAIAGPAARKNLQLNSYNLITLDWKDAKKEFPDARVLSRETGYQRNYDIYYYEEYSNSERLELGMTNDDQRLGPKDWVYGIVVNGTPKAYLESDLLNVSVIKDFISDETIMVKNQDGKISFFNITTNQEIVSLRSFWFAWTAFNPKTQLYEK